MLIEEKTEGMHQNEAHQAIAQMPHIPCPHPFHLAAIRQLTEHSIDEVAYASQNVALVSCRLRRMRFAERRLQEDTLGSQEGLQIRKPIGAIPQNHARCPFQKQGSYFPIRFVGGSQVQARQQARPTELSMQAKAVKGLSICMIFLQSKEYSTVVYTYQQTIKALYAVFLKLDMNTAVILYNDRRHLSADSVQHLQCLDFPCLFSLSQHGSSSLRILSLQRRREA